MNLKRYALSSAFVFLFVFVFEFLFHGGLLKGIYQETAHLWRPEGEHKMLFILMSQLGFAVMVSFIFTLHYEGKGIGVRGLSATLSKALVPG